MIGVVIFAVAFVALVLLICWLGSRSGKTHGADHNATGTRGFWGGGG